MNKLPISCFIIAKNEADRIAITIESVKGWVSELFVIDSGSTDDTVKVAESLGAKVIFHAWPGYGMQKRFGEEQCGHNWLLNLDADEEVTPALAREIATEFSAGEPQLAGFVLRVRDLLPGEKRLAPFAHTNYCLRLYDKRKARFSESPVYDSVIVEQGETKVLKHPVLHRSFRSLGHMLDKIHLYSAAQAEAKRDKKLSPLLYLRLPLEMPLTFFKPYLMRMYILRGWRGFLYSGVYAYGRAHRIYKLIQTRYSR